MKFQRALVLVAAMLLAVVTALGAKAQSPNAQTDCSNYTEAPVGLFAGIACSPAEEWWPIFAPWEKSLEGETLNNSISSIFIREGWSIQVTDNHDNTGRTACLNSTKSVLDTDTWPGDSTPITMGNIISYIQVFSDTVCGVDQNPPVEESKTYCNNLSFAGVGLYDKEACEKPGSSLEISSTGTISLGNLAQHVSSIYVGNGRSVLISKNGQSVCVFETKWDLALDKWSDGLSQDDSILAAEAFDDPNCGAQQPTVTPTPSSTPPTVTPTPEQQKKYCDSVSFAGVGLYDHFSCETPGDHIEVTKAGSVSLGKLSKEIGSVYVSKGWSVLVSDSTGQSACLTGIKWDLSKDLWSNGQTQDDSIVAAEVFDNSACQAAATPTPTSGSTQTPEPGNTSTPEPETKYCDSLTFEGVGFFDLPACNQSGMNMTVQVPGNVELGGLAKKVSSVYINGNWSVEISDGSQTFCLTGGTKWDLSKDKWPNGQLQDNSIVSALVFDNTTCQRTVEPPTGNSGKLFLPSVFGPTPKTYCDSLTFTGIGFYINASCEQPGTKLEVTQPGGSELAFKPQSVYVAAGRSVLVFGDGDQMACLTETKWKLSEDNWPGTDNKMSNVRAFLAFDNATCKQN